VSFVHFQLAVVELKKDAKALASFYLLWVCQLVVVVAVHIHKPTHTHTHT